MTRSVFRVPGGSRCVSLHELALLTALAINLMPSRLLVACVALALAVVLQGVWEHQQTRVCALCFTPCSSSHFSHRLLLLHLWLQNPLSKASTDTPPRHYKRLFAAHSLAGNNGTAVQYAIESPRPSSRRSLSTRHLPIHTRPSQCTVTAENQGVTH
jgi:hypothetical protein